MQCGKFTLDVSSPKIMGILNVTPDSFSDGGKFIKLEQAHSQALRMQQAGADIIDIGGESTRPMAQTVSLKQELSRVIPVIEALAPDLKIPISIDTYKPEVMKAAVIAGASMINDVTALANVKSLKFAAEQNIPVCLMHMQKTPQNMQQQPQYKNVVKEVFEFLQKRLDLAQSYGIKNLIIDPGFGFGKTLEHNIELFKNLAKFTQLEVPLLVGISRKSMIGQILKLEKTQDRIIGSVLAQMIAVQNGANIIRTHDVLATRQSLDILDNLV